MGAILEWAYQTRDRNAPVNSWDVLDLVNLIHLDFMVAGEVTRYNRNMARAVILSYQHW
jgi:hypothetical protein